MNGNDIDYGELYGVETGNESENEAPETMTETTQGEEEREVAAPAEDGNGSPTNGTSPTSSDVEETSEADEESAKGKDAAAAAARRRAEAQRDAAIAQAQADAQRTVDTYVRSLGIVDPYTGKVISTQAEMEAYRARTGEEQRRNLLQRSGMNEQEFNAFVEALPEVQQSREAQRRAEEALREAQESRARERVAAQLQEITRLDPTIKSLDDLTSQENYGTIYALVQRGYSVADAFKVANFDRLREKSNAAAKQAALNSLQGKRHMDKASQRGTGAVSVPSDVKELYHMLLPNATEAEIQKHYNRSLGRG